jgi:hypothetical protein
MSEPALYVILGHSIGAVLLSWAYFRRFQVTRPPIGVLNMSDIALMLGGIVVVPYLYLALPLWLVSVLLGVAILSTLYFTFEPVLRTRTAIWLAALLLTAGPVAAGLHFGTTSLPFLVVNNIVLVVSIAGATNLWAQSGMRARDAAILAGALAIYDGIATSWLTLMADLFNRLANLPFSPVVAWPAGPDGLWLGIGIGDLLLASVFPLVMRKAFGRPAGLTALVLGLGVIAILLALPELGIVVVTFPVMVVLGPLMVLQYWYWIRRQGREHTTREYLQIEPLPGPTAHPLVEQGVAAA